MILKYESWGAGCIAIVQSYKREVRSSRVTHSWTSNQYAAAFQSCCNLHGVVGHCVLLNKVVVRRPVAFRTVNANTNSISKMLRGTHQPNASFRDRDAEFVLSGGAY